MPTKKKDASSDGLFSAAPPKKVTGPVEDLFGDDLSFEPESSLFSDTNKKSKKPKLFEDDLFADLDVSTKKKTATKPVENVRFELICIAHE